MKEPRISVVATEALLEALIAAAKALRASRRKDGVSPAVLNALIVQVSTARGTFEHAQKVAAKAVPAHQVAQGETEYVWRQSCQCPQCVERTAQIAAEQKRGVQTV
jgi:hypothetical protein